MSDNFLEVGSRFAAVAVQETSSSAWPLIGVGAAEQDSPISITGRGGSNSPTSIDARYQRADGSSITIGTGGVRVGLQFKF
jgi:hypothetical protein